MQNDISSRDDQVNHTITNTEDIYQLGAAGTVSTCLPEIVYTSVQTLTTSTLPTLALSSEGISAVSLCYSNYCVVFRNIYVCCDRC